MRLVQIPTFLRLLRSDAELVTTLRETIESHRWTSVLVVSGPSATQVLASGFAGKLGAATVAIDAPTFEEVLRLERCVFVQRADAIIAVGGGGVIDVAKYTAHRARVPFLSVPTQASNDGIASPIAVIHDAEGRRHSLGATVPVGVFAPVHVIERAREDTLRAGLGDLLSNYSALEDWRVAHELGADTFDDFAALMARHGAELALALVERGNGLASPGAVDALVEGLVLSGIAMSVAGTSRPCSGAEHLISHAIDALFGGIALHGIQVGAAAPFVLELQGKAELGRRIREALCAIGSPGSLSDLGLTEPRLTALLDHAPATRPGRYTVLSDLPGARARVGLSMGAA
jgi:glycerol-1-phosphate dehydrogenase [NAD(P)+]